MAFSRRGTSDKALASYVQVGWVVASGYSQAQSDPLPEHKSDIMQHMNADHKDALILIAKRFAGIEAQQAEMTAVDRLGFHLRLTTRDGMKGTRVGSCGK